jgi:hypothetical protein
MIERVIRLKKIVVTGAGGPAGINFINSLRLAPEKFLSQGQRLMNVLSIWHQRKKRRPTLRHWISYANHYSQNFSATFASPIGGRKKNGP